jgi:DNA-binding transcriptional LysR family regulator
MRGARLPGRARSAEERRRTRAARLSGLSGAQPVDGTLERVLPAWEQPADVWAMSAARAAQSAKVRVCIDFLKQELAHGEFALWKP